MAKTINVAKVSPALTIKGMPSQVSYVNENRKSGGSSGSAISAIDLLQTGTDEEKDNKILDKDNRTQASSVGIFEILTGRTKTKTPRPSAAVPKQKSRVSQEKHSVSSKEKPKSRNQPFEKGIIII